MNIYVQGLASGIIWLALTVVSFLAMRSSLSQETSSYVLTALYIAAFMVIGYFYKIRYRTFYSSLERKALKRTALFALGAATIAGPIRFAMSGFKLWEVPIIAIVLLLPLSVLLVVPKIGALMWVGGLFRRSEEPGQPPVIFETVATSNSIGYLEILQARLRAEGVPAFIKNEGMNQMIPVGGVELQVPEERAEEAREIVAAIDSGEFDLKPNEKIQ